MSCCMAATVMERVALFRFGRTAGAVDCVFNGYRNEGGKT